MAINGIALGSIAAGTVFVYAGITGKSVLGSIQAVVRGQAPSLLADINPISGTGNPNATPVGSGQMNGSASGWSAANDAMKYIGHLYIYGGVPGTNGQGGWDCSSFMNWVLGHDLGMTLPGGVTGYDGSTHGPVASSYQSFGTAIPRSSVETGDLVVWSTHIGIALNNTTMLSALNPSLGTAITGIENGGPQGESLVCRRI